MSWERRQRAGECLVGLVRLLTCLAAGLLGAGLVWIVTLFL